MRRTLRFCRQPHPNRQLGQSAVELAILTPVLALLLMGGFDASIMASDKVTSGSAVRQGARLAAELGGAPPNPGATTADIDMQIVHNVLAMAGGLTSSPVSEIDIYAPTREDGHYRSGVGLVDKYFLDPGGAGTD